MKRRNKRRERTEEDKELDDWANMAKIARTSWTKDNPWEEDRTANIITNNIKIWVYKR